MQHGSADAAGPHPAGHGKPLAGGKRRHKTNVMGLWDGEYIEGIEDRPDAVAYVPRAIQQVQIPTPVRLPAVFGKIENIGYATAFARLMIIMAAQKVARSESGRLGVGKTDITKTGHLADKIKQLRRIQPLIERVQGMSGMQPGLMDVENRVVVVEILKVIACLGKHGLLKALMLFRGHGCEGLRRQVHVFAAVIKTQVPGCPLLQDLVNFFCAGPVQNIRYMQITVALECQPQGLGVQPLCQTEFHLFRPSGPGPCHRWRLLLQRQIGYKASPMNNKPPETPPMTPADAWSTYWDKGALHSCPSAFGANYDDEISAFWVGFFSGLPDNASIIDIGTGNGGIAFLARDVGQQTGKHFRVTGIDAATISPAVAARHHGIAMDGVSFQSQVPAEATGFPDASLDAVVSQYAIEYSDTGASLAEAARILKPSGRLALLMHHSESAAADATRTELAAFDFMAGQAPLLSCATWLVDHLLASGPDPDPMLLMQDTVAATQVAHFGRLRDSLVAYAGKHPDAGFVRDLALRISGILQHIPTTGGIVARQNLQHLAREMAAHRSRLQAMIDACHSQADIEHLKIMLQDNGLSCQHCEKLYRNQQDLMGWTIVAQRG